MAAPTTQKFIAVLETQVAHVVATAGTAFGVAVAELGTNFTKAGLIAAAVAAAHVTFQHFFPHGASDPTPPAPPAA
jgi:hypothetical protein